MLAAIAWSFPILALSRVLQAVSGSLVSTSATALVREGSPSDRRGAAFGLFDMLVSVSAAVGPLVGGLIVSGFGWRALFFVAVPIALIAAVAVGVIAPPRLHPDQSGLARGSPRPIDLRGLAVLAALLVALVLALRGGDEGVLALIGAIAVLPLLVLLLVVELRSDHPAVDPRLFAAVPFATAVAGVFGATVILHGSFVLVPILVETIRGSSPETSGFVLLGISAFWALIAPFGGRLSDAFGRRLPSVVGMAVTAAGLAALVPAAASAPPLVLAGLVSVVGLGMGLSGSPRQAAAMDAIDSARVGMAAGTYYTGRYLGGVLGASLAGAVLGQSITAGAVSMGFAWLAVVAVAVAFVSFGLPARSSRASAVAG
jgi:MFS family permease